MKAIIGVVIAILIIGGGYVLYTKDRAENSQELSKIGDTVAEDGHEDVMERDGDTVAEDGHEEGIVIGDDFNIRGIVSDVSGGEATGDVKARFAKNAYMLIATFEGLTDPEGTDFYEGWVVRRGDDTNVVSTGKVKEEEIGYVNVFISPNDLSDHDFYVLTLEPDDGDPEPAKHILEGVIQ